MPAWMDDFGIEMQLAGAVLCQEDGTELTQEDGSTLVVDGYGFVDITDDVLADISWEKGSLDTRIDSRVAGVGSFKFRLRNADHRYSPDHANVREGFDRDRRARLYLEYNGERRYKWSGFVSRIRPIAGSYGPRYTEVEAESAMLVYHEFGEMRTQEFKENKKPHELYETITQALTKYPPDWEFEENNNKLLIALDAGSGKNPKAASELHKVSLSVLDRILEVGDEQHGGKIISKTYKSFMKDNTVLSTLDNVMRDLSAERSRDSVLKQVRVTFTPRKEAEEEEFIWFLDKSVYVRPNETVEIEARFTDPENQSTDIIVKDVNRNLVAGTDFNFGGEKSGGGKNAYAAITVTPGARSAIIRITNNHPTKAGYLNLARLEGIIIRAYNDVDVIAANEGALVDNELAVSIAYIEDRVRADAIAQVIRDDLGASPTVVSQIAFNGNYSQAHMEAAVLREPGDRVAYAEAQTGIDTEGFVLGERGRIYGGGVLDMVWVVEKAPPADVLLIGITGRDEIDGTNVVRGI